MSRIDIRSGEYPYLLKQIKDPPKILYYRGRWDPGIFEESLSVVGSRRMTRYGETMTNELVDAIAGAGISIVSGFMYGIDAQAHEAALEAGGRTVAVMPCGIGRIHPKYQVELYERIIRDHGLVISEYPGDTPPALWTYPRRNRIIVGLSPVLLVVEAGRKSGALISARIAKEYNKRIFAVPGPLTSSVSRGTAFLIKQGGSIVTDTEDILREYRRHSYSRQSFAKEGERVNRLQKKILSLLSREPMDPDEIIRTIGKSASKIGSELSLLCLKGILILEEGRYVLRRGARHVD